MKKLFIWSLVAAASMFSVACDDDNGEKPTPEGTKVTMTPAHAIGGYYKEMLSDGSNCYMLALSNLELEGVANDPVVKNGDVLMLQLYAPSAAEGVYDVIPEGTYKVVNGSTAVVAGTCYGDQSVFGTTGDDGKVLTTNYLKAGSKVIVTKVGTGYKIDVEATLSNSKTFSTSFTGEIKLSQYFMKYSTLQEDYEVDLKNNTCRMTYMKPIEDKNGNSFGVWAIEILRFTSSGIPANGSEGMVIQVLTEPGTFEAGIPAGKYDVTDQYAYFACLPGSTDATLNMYFTWYMGNFNASQAQAMAPIRSGSADIEKSGDVYTITFDFIDDNQETPHKVTGTWTGTPTYKDSSK